jgi:hypothetical protein
MACNWICSLVRCYGGYQQPFRLTYYFLLNFGFHKYDLGTAFLWLFAKFELNSMPYLNVKTDTWARGQGGQF